MIYAAHIKPLLIGLHQVIWHWFFALKNTLLLPWFTGLVQCDTYLEYLNGVGIIDNSNRAAHGKRGFTLIELSVVIVILGLLVGGILVGRDLIKSAELRATIGQLDKYSTAVNTFKLKFVGLPGDILKSEATSFGLFAFTGASTTGFGDGNALIEGSSAGGTVPVGETIIFWRHLYEAGYVDGALGVQSNSVLVVSTGAVSSPVSSISQSLPVTKLQPENGFVVYSANGFNYFQIVPVNTITTSAYTFNSFGLTPISASNIDTKLDDGKPNVGAIIARGISAINAAPSFSGTSSALMCTIGTGASTDTYNGVIATGGTDTSCSLRIRFQ